MNKPKIELLYMHGRIVVAERINGYYEQEAIHGKNLLCSDCRKPAIFIMHEMSDGDRWKWCGECDIG